VSLRHVAWGEAGVRAQAAASRASPRAGESPGLYAEMKIGPIWSAFSLFACHTHSELYFEARVQPPRCPLRASVSNGRGVAFFVRRAAHSRTVTLRRSPTEFSFTSSSRRQAGHRHRVSLFRPFAMKLCHGLPNTQHLRHTCTPRPAFCGAGCSAGASVRAIRV
jgi:hypothetical protein